MSQIMENDYWIRVNKDGIVTEIKRDLDLHYTAAPENKLSKIEYYIGVFRAESIEDAAEKAKQAYLSY